MRAELPSGTVVFLFTDSEGSTRVLHALGPDAYARALSEHRGLVRDAFAVDGGVEVDTQGRVLSSHSRQHPFGALTTRPSTRAPRWVGRPHSNMP